MGEIQQEEKGWTRKYLLRITITDTCTHPKYVIDKESSQKNAAGCYCVQVKQFNSIERECQTKYVIGNPVLKGSKKTNKQSIHLR